METPDKTDLDTDEENKNFTVSLKHKKCFFINKVREQITTVESKYACSDCNNKHRWLKCWDHCYCIFVILIVILLAWLCIIYGAVIGAALCTHLNSGSFIPIFRIPGLHWPTKSDTKVWKAF